MRKYRKTTQPLGNRKKEGTQKIIFSKIASSSSDTRYNLLCFFSEEKDPWAS